MSATMRKKVTARAPATVANVGPGFDVLGFALAAPEARVTAARGTRGAGITLAMDVDLPSDPRRNTAGAAVLALCGHLRESPDLQLQIQAGIPIGSGMGSSAASAVAAVVAANALFGAPLAREALLPFALVGEATTSGARHADNVVPALFGGWTAVRAHDPADWIALARPRGLQYVVVHPA
ncbi:MAG: homoserine kinase, partial [Deltaproteobacteria bacterium]|nr:homoserine kinase [Deltaproteobacteria bacterium]